jgi:hypothetical protein
MIGFVGAKHLPSKANRLFSFKGSVRHPGGPGSRKCFAPYSALQELCAPGDGAKHFVAAGPVRLMDGAGVPKKD